jgi:hypothetical protein
MQHPDTAMQTSTSTVNIANANVATTTSTTPQSTSTPKPSTGTFFGSFSAGAYYLNWTDTPDYTDFTFTNTISSSGRKKRDITPVQVSNAGNVYIAFGLSTDNLMV